MDEWLVWEEYGLFCSVEVLWVGFLIGLLLFFIYMLWILLECYSIGYIDGENGWCGKVGCWVYILFFVVCWIKSCYGVIWIRIRVFIVEVDVVGFCICLCVFVFESKLLW